MQSAPSIIIKHGTKSTLELLLHTHPDINRMLFSEEWSLSKFRTRFRYGLSLAMEVNTPDSCSNSNNKIVFM